MAGSGATSVHVLRVQLAGIRPPIWRDLQVPSDTTLAKLHAAIQAAMPWANCHLHAFRSGRTCVTATEDDPEAGRAEERRFSVADVLPQVGAQLLYDYDFGDSWVHEVTVREVRALAPRERVPKIACLVGARACPPDDCGGVRGYATLVFALADPGHERHAELKRWLTNWRAELAGYDERFRGPFDPEAFDVEATNRALAKIRRTQRS